MRAARLIITTLLALELFVTAGLCGGACCAAATVRTDHGDSALKKNYAPATEEKVEGGHCPMHAAKKIKSRSQEQRQSKTTQPSAVTHHQNHPQNHQGNHQARLAPTIEAHLCACSDKREALLSDALLPEQRPAAQIFPGAPIPARWLIETSPSPIVAPYLSRSHSPPFCGLQLNLRI